jgi:hypothetical protein
MYFYFIKRLAGTFGAVLTCPLEVIKTRYQSSQNLFSKTNTHLNLNSSMSNTITHNVQSSTLSIHKRPSIIGSFRYEFYGKKKHGNFIIFI